ncbi:UNVERIFIED_CONTAM: hypothetical protein NCL1_46949 [Trichonephila clavipes]
MSIPHFISYYFQKLAAFGTEIYFSYCRKDYKKRKDIYYDNLRAEKAKQQLKKTSEKKDDDNEDVKGVVRFEKAGIAAHILEKAAEEDGVKKFTFGSCKATISPVEGDSEQEYWKSIVKSKIDMKQKKFIDGRKGRFKKNFFGKRQRGNAQEDGNANESSHKKLKSESTEEADQESNGQEKEMSEATS